MRKNHIKGFALATAAVFGLLACGGSDATTEDTAAPVSTDAAADYSMLKVAVVYIGVPDDKGWTYQHEQGILSLESELGIEVVSKFRVANARHTEIVTLADVPT